MVMLMTNKEKVLCVGADSESVSNTVKVVISDEIKHTDRRFLIKYEGK